MASHSPLLAARPLQCSRHASHLIHREWGVGGWGEDTVAPSYRSPRGLRSAPGDDLLSDTSQLAVRCFAAGFPYSTVDQLSAHLSKY